MSGDEDVCDEEDLVTISGFLRDFEVIPDAMDAMTLFDLADSCKKLFCGHFSLEQYQRRNVILFGDHTQVEIRFKMYAKTVTALVKCLHDMPAEDVNDDQRAEISSILTQTAANIFHGREAMIYLFKQVFLNNEELSRCLAKPRMESFYQNITEDEMKNHQKLIRYYLQICRRRKYRKLYGKDTLFEPMFTESGHYTHHFGIACEMEEFVYDAV
jgi:hypothetical protein